MTHHVLARASIKGVSILTRVEDVLLIKLAKANLQWLVDNHYLTFFYVLRGKQTSTLMLCILNGYTRRSIV